MAGAASKLGMKALTAIPSEPNAAVPMTRLMTKAGQLPGVAAP